jgi:nucleoside-diphosphate-sugar epimerase
MPIPARVLILGGTGTTGAALIRQLRSGDEAADLTVVSRTAVEVPGATRVVTGHFADLVGSADFRRDLAAHHTVVHLADGLAILQDDAHAADTGLADSLIAASQNLALAARAARVPLFVHVSSIKALCDEEDDRILIEASEPRPTTLYGQSKLRLEQAVGAALAGSATRLVILRNPVMYGGSKGGSFQRLVKLANLPLPLPLDGLTNRRSVLAVRNFAAALATIVRAGAASTPGIFHVHDGPPLTTTEIVEALRTALGRPRRLFAVGAAAAAIARRTPLLASVARRVYGSLELSDAHFRRCFRHRIGFFRNKVCRLL